MMSVELDVTDHQRTSTQSADRPRISSAPPPPDNGPKAMSFLVACFLIEAIIWGFTVSFGVFQAYYDRLDEFQNSRPNIPVIGTLSTSFIFLGTPFATPLVKRYHAWRQWMIVAGCTLCAASLVGASFTHSVAGLLATQGTLYGIGVLVVYAPLLSLINEWFINRRGFAYGIAWAGGGISGVGLPFLVEWLLASYGYHTTLRVIAISQAVLLAPVLPFVKPRVSSSSSEATGTELDFLRQPTFWLLMASNSFHGFAYYIPSLYLPTFASLVGLSPRIGALLLAVLNFSSTIGQVGFGHLSDRTHYFFILVFSTTFVSGTASFFIWGYAQSLAPLLVYAILFGLFAGSYVVFWPTFSLISKDPLTLYGLFSFGKGIGNIVTGPITARLLATNTSSSYGLGTYKNVIIYTGALLLASSISIFGWPLKGCGHRILRADRSSAS
ncbi:MFS general substrate transporter [Xylaria bambusicola]|uniref:MFS general substrate transporter n=1 Tax=Xylaria bambusicola TaxID=326684 RepID=UPI002007617C|nr:MFS general substrate transporter [Xylaria bambusicola]KAI0528141.1 MFS general substrate transporter [Xylaria bambusicola]